MLLPTCPDNAGVALFLPFILVSALWDHAKREAPRECVGAIGGHRRGAAAEAVALYPLANVSPDPERTYLADAGHLLRALKAMQAADLTLVALYHSHPHGPGWPSETDTRLAAYPVPYVIADLRARTLAAYLLPGGTPVSLRLGQSGENGQV
ncbi:M67 family metallopeptidase [Deinococcus hopiensis]|uniref:Proteasome lid subunit RPN8/RPN11, contains Jab1/MPN metalloenzyme (JAMM) motif n=1 Tax=Deinococcus hopiensis KR-140 TaxID=695939 RepID=A0A1W1VM74_9DEIO|nr:Proteasome lid subunit RPN8/RPN11, contains Jab1/MPN metalloenzyme (JAMM) motif [Deinococcus hopiensis KR-140]